VIVPWEVWMTYDAQFLKESLFHTFNVFVRLFPFFNGLTNLPKKKHFDKLERNMLLKIEPKLTLM
jgi:hypothetical protein